MIEDRKPSQWEPFTHCANTVVYTLQELAHGVMYLSFAYMALRIATLLH